MSDPSPFASMTAQERTRLRDEALRSASPPVTRAGSLLHRAVEGLGRAIIVGEFAPGDILPVEDDLAARFAVGRNVIREAVKILGEKRLLRTERRAGTVVLPAAEWNGLDQEIIAWTLDHPPSRQALIDDLTGLRTVIEPQAAALAARHGSASEKLRIVEALEAMERADNTEAEAIASDILFHQRLFEATHNRLLLSLVRVVTAVLQANFETSIHVEAEAIRHHLLEHRRVAQAVLHGDAAEAHEAMSDLLAGNAVHLAQMRTALAGRERAGMSR